MKRVISYGVLVLIIFIGLISCSLFLPSNDPVYFYSMVDANTDYPDYSLDYQNDRYTVIMSRGVGGTRLTKENAEALVGSTVFTLSLGGGNIVSQGDKGVDELLTDDWHVVESFVLPHLEKGVYILRGITDMSGSLRDNSVNLTIR